MEEFKLDGVKRLSWNVAPSNQTERNAKLSCCQHKKAYPTQELAEAAKDRILATGKEKPKPGQILHSYLCPYCSKYHTGHHTPRNKTERENQIGNR